MLQGRCGAEKKHKGELWGKSQPHYPKDRAPRAVPPPQAPIAPPTPPPHFKLSTYSGLVGKGHKNTVHPSGWVGGRTENCQKKGKAGICC